jgi:hypothetical protein
MYDGSLDEWIGGRNVEQIMKQLLQTIFTVMEGSVN